jgi:hypothetical protein
MAGAPPIADPTFRMALGIEPRDALRGGRLSHPVRVDVEWPEGWAAARSTQPYFIPVERGDVRPRVNRHPSGRHVLLVHPALKDQVSLRIHDDSRRFVPRRLAVKLAAGLSQVRRPSLFGGAAYDLGERTTGLRGRVLRGGKPLRWARVEAVRADTGDRVGWAHGDDRGEFLLVLRSAGFASLAELDDPLDLRVRVAGPTVAPIPADLDLPTRDPLWDLPIELLDPASVDPFHELSLVAGGEALPDGYAFRAAAGQVVPFQLGRLLSAFDGVFDFDFGA